MRPLTAALLRANSENLAKKGWKTDEQRRCFKKADALLDYISQIPSDDYIKGMWHSKIRIVNSIGLMHCLEQDLPSKKMQIRSLEILNTLLFMGRELLERAAWLYKNHPALFKAKYASSKQAFEKDAHFYFIGHHVVPENSFPPFKTGENPAFSRDKAFIKKCIEMYNYPLFNTFDFKEYKRQTKTDKDPYIQWVRNKRAGRKFSDERLAIQDEIMQLRLKTEIGLRLNKLELMRNMQMKKERIL